MKLGAPGMAHYIPLPLSLPMFVIGVIMLVVVSNPEDVHRPAPGANVAVAWLLALLGFVGILPKGKNQAQVHEEALDAEFQTMEIEAELIADLRKDLGDGDLDFYQNLQAERHAFVERYWEMAKAKQQQLKRIDSLSNPELESWIDSGE